jgi:N-acetylglucosamine-6-phosphate deacetylase
MAMQWIGRDVATHTTLEVSGGSVLTAVRESAEPCATYLAPGFVDIQVNGFGGVDYCAPDSSLSSIDHSLELLFSTGVTRFFPTVITASPENLLGALANLARARAKLPHGGAIAGIHVEGPHISPEDGPRGAHPRAAVRPPSIEEFERWQEAAEGNVRLVTLSPEWENAPAYIEHLAARGVVAAIGHTAASASRINAAVRAGATLSTHLGNGAHALLPRHPNYLWQQLAEDRLAASFIVDGIHLGNDFLNVALRAKGLDRAVLITDATMPTLCAPGPYRLGEVEVTLHAAEPGRCGRVTLRDGERLAGSALRMDRGVENLMRLGGLSLGDAVAMATRNPARVARIAQRQDGLAAGERADLVEFAYDAATRSVEIRRTWLDGELVFAA